jgi:hypothetical protein
MESTFEDCVTTIGYTALLNHNTDTCIQVIKILFNIPLNKDDPILSQFIDHVMAMCNNDPKVIHRLSTCLKRREYWYVLSIMNQEQIYFYPEWMLKERLITHDDLFHHGCRNMKIEMVIDALKNGITYTPQIIALQLIQSSEAICQLIVDQLPHQRDEIIRSLKQCYCRQFRDHYPRTYCLNWMLQHNIIEIDQVLKDACENRNQPIIKYAINHGAHNLEETQHSLEHDKNRLYTWWWALRELQIKPFDLWGIPHGSYRYEEIIHLIELLPKIDHNKVDPVQINIDPTIPPDDSSINFTYVMSTYFDILNRRTLDTQTIIKNIYYDPNCAICLESLKETHIFLNNCGHCFHADCVKGLRVCPICRENIN